MTAPFLFNLQTRTNSQVLVCKIYCDDWITSKLLLLQIQDVINLNKSSKLFIKAVFMNSSILFFFFFALSKKLVFSIRCSVIKNAWNCAHLSCLALYILLFRPLPSWNGFNTIMPLLCTFGWPELYFVKLVKSQFWFSTLSNFILSHVSFFDFLGVIKWVTGMNECFICSGFESSNGYFEDSSINSLENSLARARERQTFKDTGRISLNGQLTYLLRIWKKKQFDVNERMVETLWYMCQSGNINIQHRL